MLGGGLYIGSTVYRVPNIRGIVFDRPNIQRTIYEEVFTYKEYLLGEISIIYRDFKASCIHRGLTHRLKASLGKTKGEIR